MQQHLVAGQKGVRHRQERAAIKAELRRGERRISELLAEPTVPECLRTMLLHDLLQAVPYLRRFISEFMGEVPIRLTATVAEPTYRKRRELADRLQKWERSLDGRRASRRRFRSGNKSGALRRADRVA